MRCTCQFVHPVSTRFSISFHSNTTPNLNQFFFEASCVLKPGGRLYFFFTPCVYLEHQQPYDFSRFTRFGLHNMCIQNGLEFAGLQPSNSMLYAAVTLLKWARDDVQQIQGQGETVESVGKVISMLSDIFKKYDDGLTEQLPASYLHESIFSQAPPNYCWSRQNSVR